MKTLLYAPWWFLQLFTTAKSFRDNPLLGSPLLNKLGLHLLRTVSAHGVMRLRMGMLGLGVNRADKRSYQQQGFILKENFLPSAQFAAIDAEIRHFQGDPRTTSQGDTETQRTLLDPDTLQALPHTAALLADPEFCRLLCYANGHQRLPFFNVEQIRNGTRAGEGDDPQKQLHIDTFHPTMKFWLYLDDVDEHNGPFTYVPSSNRLSQQRLAWEYRMSQQAHHHPDRYTARGSFRVTPEAHAQMQLPAARAFKVKKNTLLIANTFGIHGRGQADAGSTRLALWGMGRTNPFIPFPGTGLAIINRLQYTALKHLKF